MLGALDRLTPYLRKLPTGVNSHCETGNQRFTPNGVALPGLHRQTSPLSGYLPHVFPHDQRSIKRSLMNLIH
jgi:hypothetical protein